MKVYSTKIMLFIAVALVLFGSCSTTKTYDAKTLSTNGKLYQKGTIVDLDVSNQKIYYEKNNITKDERSLGEKKLKEAIVALALKEAKADVLIEPRFTMTKDGFAKFAKIIAISVDGYPATYKDFRPVQASDTTFLIMSGEMTPRPVIKKNWIDNILMK